MASSKFQFRGFSSILLSISFVIVVVTGLVLWLSHSPQTFGIGKGLWKHTHIFTSLLMLIVGVVHICLNWRIFVSYLWDGASRRLNQKREMLLASVVVAVVVLPGFLVDQGGAGPFAKMSATEIAAKAGQKVEVLVENLKKDGVAVHDPADSLIEIAKHNNLSVDKLFTIVQRHAPEAMRRPH
jgi:hypothetical protein